MNTQKYISFDLNINTIKKIKNPNIFNNKKLIIH